MLIICLKGVRELGYVSRDRASGCTETERSRLVSPHMFISICVQAHRKVSQRLWVPDEWVC